MTVPRHNLTVVLADGTPVPVDGIGVTMFSPTTWFVRALSVGILSMSSFDDNKCSTHFHDGRMEIYDSEWKIVLTGTRCFDNLYYLDQAHIERALSIAQRMYTLPQSIPETESTPLGLIPLKMKILKLQNSYQMMMMMMKVIILKRARMLRLSGGTERMECSTIWKRCKSCSMSI